MTAQLMMIEVAAVPKRHGDRWALRHWCEKHRVWTHHAPDETHAPWMGAIMPKDSGQIGEMAMIDYILNNEPYLERSGQLRLGKTKREVCEALAKENNLPLP